MSGTKAHYHHNQKDIPTIRESGRTGDSMSKCKYNDGLHVVKAIETGQFILHYCTNCSMNVKLTDK